MEMYVGVARGCNPFADLIAGVTMMRLMPPWVMGRPATHAFPVFREGRMAMALHAQPPRATWGAFHVPPDPGSCQLWQVKLEQHAIQAAYKRACELEGTLYDPVELVQQLSVSLAKLPGLPGSYICTSLSIEVVQALGGFPEGIMDALPNKYPETFARAWEAAEGSWWLHRLKLPQEVLYG